MIQNLQKTLTSVVFLVKPQPVAAPPAIIQVSSVIDMPEVSLEGEILTITSMRNQLKVVIEGNRRMICQDMSGDSPIRSDFPDRILRLADLWQKSTGAAFVSIGINFDAKLVPESDTRPSSVILNRLIRSDAFRNTNYTLLGASVRFWYEADGNRHFLYLEPERNSLSAARFNIHLNASHAVKSDALPTAEDFRNLVDHEFADLKRVLEAVLIQPRNA